MILVQLFLTNVELVAMSVLLVFEFFRSIRQVVSILIELIKFCSDQFAFRLQLTGLPLLLGFKFILLHHELCLRTLGLFMKLSEFDPLRLTRGVFFRQFVAKFFGFPSVRRD